MKKVIISRDGVELVQQIQTKQWKCETRINLDRKYRYFLKIHSFLFITQ